jgi:hypothetical protein
MTNDEKQLLEQVMLALDKLMNTFKFERILYLIGAFASVMLFVYAAYRLFSQKDPSSSDMVIVLGASGVATACSSRVAHFLSRSFKIIESVIAAILKKQEAR